MARPTPYVRESVLTCPGVDGSPQSLLIGSPDWYRWLADETHRSFAFESPRGTFTARKERKQRGGWYWTAYRQSQGKLYKAYLGRSEEVTPERLEGVASLLAERIAGQRRTTNDQRPTTNDERPTTDNQRPTTDDRQPTTDDQGLTTDPNSKLITHNPKLVSDILTTKLYVPRTRPGLVPRPRLLARLDAGLSGALTLVCAPADFGKTTLLTDWLGQQDEFRPGRTQRPGAWLSLDSGDNDLLQFLRYLVAALQTVAPSRGAALLSLLHPGITQLPSLPSLLTLLINDLALLPAESILVLDDYHVVSEPRIHEAITFLLDHLPPQLHVVIVTRVDPLLPLARLRAHGLLTEVRAADLRFTTEEAAAFLTEVMRLPLSPADVLALEERTEGWIAGLQFAALAMRDRSDLQSFVDAFTGSHRYILDYLVEEVLTRQPPHLQTFLLQTSILDRLCGPLCDEVVGGAEGQSGYPLAGEGAEETEDEAPSSSNIQHPTSKIQNRNGQALLEELERANLFLVPLDDAGQWYRYHHLFAEVLRHRLQGSAMPDGVRTLHLRAAAWYERHGLIVEAVEHSFRAEDVERSAQLIEQVALRLIGRGEASLLQQWLARLPVEVIRTRPRLSLASAWTLTFTAEIDAMEAHLHDAARLLEAGSSAEESTAEQDRLRGELLALRGFVALRRKEIPAAITLFQQAHARVSTDDMLLSGFIAHHLGFTYRLNGDPAAAGRAFAEAGALFGRSADTRILALYPLTALATIEEMQGHLHQAAQTHRRALELAVVDDRPLPLAGHSYVGLGRLHREWNDLPTAGRYFEQGIELAKQAGFDAVVAEGSVGLASVLQAQGKRDDANALIQQALDAARRWNVGGAVARIAAAGAHLWLLQGRIAAAAQWAQESRLDVDNVPDVQIGHLTLARLLLAQRRLEEAQRLLERLLAIAEAGSQMGRAIEILVLQALAHHYAGSQTAALAALQRALLLAEPEGYVRTFVDEGPAMATLLAAASRQRPRGSPATSYRPYIERLLAAFGEGAEGQRGSGTHRLGDGGSQAEIISLGPVRPTPLSPVELLSSRELEVLRLIAAGQSNPEIAQALVVAVSTVKAHINNIFGKLGVTSRTQAIVRARELQIL